MPRINRRRYGVQKIYVIVCRTCNEDITRPLAGEDLTTLREVEEAMQAHEEVFHPAPEAGDRLT